MAAQPVVLVDLVAEARAAPAVPMYKVNSITYTCQAAVAKLKEIQRGSSSDRWTQMTVCTVGQGASETPKLKCNHCNNLFCVSNPSQTLKTHLTPQTCKGLQRQAAAEAAAAAAASAGGGGSSSSSSSNTINTSISGGAATGKRKAGSSFIMCATADQQQAFEKDLARFFFKNGIPLQLVEHPDLRKAVAHVGLLPPSRKTLSNKLLDEEYNVVRAEDNARLALQRLIQFSSDGWRRRAAVGGKPLLNFLALLAMGRPIFLKVISAAGEVKDKHWIAARHLEIAEETTGGQLDRVLGFVMDNTKANM